MRHQEQGSPYAPRLVGRDPQLHHLTTALDQAMAGAPRVVVIEAEPGMGKSSLLDAFAQASAGSARRIWASCDPYEVDIPYGALSMILEDLPDPETSPIAAATRMLRLVGEIQQDRGAVLMILDDIQWMDARSVEAIRFALRRLRADRVLTLLARRPVVGTDPWAGLVADARTASLLALSPLTSQEIADLANKERGWELDQPTVERVRQHTGGLPLLVQTFLAGAAEVELAKGSLPVPASSAAAVERVLATVDADARALILALAVLDEPTALIPLASVAQVSDLTHALAEALGTRLVQLDARDDPTLVKLTHDLLRRAVYDGMALETRRAMHRRAVALSTGTRSLGHRVAATEGPDDDLAAALKVVALEDARQGRASLAATRLLQARSITTVSADRDVLLLKALIYRVRAEDLTGAEALRVSAEDCRPSRRRSHALGLLEKAKSNLPQAAALLTDAYERAVAAGSVHVAELISVDLASVYASLRRGPETIEAAGRGLTSTDPWVARTSRWHYAIGLGIDDVRAALVELERFPRAAEAAPQDADALAARAELRMRLGDLTGAHDDLDVAIRFGGHAGRFEPLIYSYFRRNYVRFLLGRWDEAAVDAANVRALADVGGVAINALLSYSASVLVPAGRGEWEVTDDYLAMARETAARMGDIPLVAPVVPAIFLATSRGDYDELLRLVSPEVDRLMRADPGDTPRWMYIGAVVALVHAGRLPESQAVMKTYEQAAALSADFPGLTQLPHLRGLLAEARGEPAAARAAYATGLAHPKTAEVPLAHATLLQAAGRLERVLGNRREAVEQLRPAREIFVRLRAMPYLERCDAEIAACGFPQVSASKVVRSPLALTPREQDVATLIGRGLSNAEAATALFVTGKTVEYHLSNIYAKLGVKSRRELAAVIAT